MSRKILADIRQELAEKRMSGEVAAILHRHKPSHFNPTLAIPHLSLV